VLDAYREHARHYERRTSAYQTWRRRIVDSLPLRTGDTVLDVACGTGLCLPMLRARVGSKGSVVGIDESPDMLAVARERVHDNGWRNVTLIESRVERVELPVTADAALFCAAHDVLRSPPALERVFGHLRPGAWVAAGGGKYGPPWMVGLNMMVFATHRPYVRDFEGFDQPWTWLQRYVDSFRLNDLTSGYVALGRAPEN
jgi:SAM-dependent methyltransferase